MKYFVVNRNDLGTIESIDSDTETALHVWTADDRKYTRFGPTVFLFKAKSEAKKAAARFLDEQLAGYEGQVKRIKEKKTKLENVK